MSFGGRGVSDVVIDGLVGLCVRGVGWERVLFLRHGDEVCVLLRLMLKKGFGIGQVRGSVCGLRMMVLMIVVVVGGNGVRL